MRGAGRYFFWHTAVVAETLYKRFHRSVNMSPAEIRQWAEDPRSRCYSQAATHARLPRLAALKAKRKGAWTAADRAYAKRVVAFNARFEGMRARYGCSEGITIALRNWGRKTSGCRLPASCKGGRGRT